MHRQHMTQIAAGTTTDVLAWPAIAYRADDHGDTACTVSRELSTDVDIWSAASLNVCKANLRVVGAASHCILNAEHAKLNATDK
jgi:hypothetical protein